MSNTLPDEGSSSMDRTHQRFLTAASDVLAYAMRRVHEDEPEAVAYLRRAVMAGGMTRVYATLSPAGVAWVGVQVIEPNGTTHDVGQVELRREDA